jgi:6-pyruvoyltetrahydropterin/6-carboxytetrahydropterin synthase
MERDTTRSARPGPAEDTTERRGEFRVSVTKDYLVFSSAHFVTFAGHRCEGLHGHNYRAHVTVEGALDEETWLVFDFVVLKKIMRRLCEEIDHKVLLPLQNPYLQVAEAGESVTVAYEGKPRYVFPRVDCALLPVPNTTVEMIAELLTCRLRHQLETRGACGLTAIEMEIEENFGQSAVYRVQLS